MENYKTDISDLYWLNSVAEAEELQHKLNITLEDSELSSLPDASSAFLRIINEMHDGTPTKKLYVSQNAAGPYVYKLLHYILKLLSETSFTGK